MAETTRSSTVSFLDQLPEANGQAIVLDGAAWTLFAQLPEGCRPTYRGRQAET